MTSKEHGTFPPDTRDEILAADRHKCQICGSKGPKKDGTATLEAHHIEDNPPDGIDYHDAANGTTLCSVCHDFVTERVPDDLPFGIAELESNLKLRPYDLEILSVLARRGPCTLVELVANIPENKSENATRERLWHLMGHDNRIDHLSHQLIDQDIDTGEWGLPNQIDRSSRGQLPDNKDMLLQRIEDEMVRLLLNNGLDRPTVADIVDIDERTTYHKEKRAMAYELPLGNQSPSGSSYRTTTESEAESLESALLDRPLRTPDETSEEKASKDAEDTPPEGADIEAMLSEISEQLAQLTELAGNDSDPGAQTEWPPDPQISD